MIFTFLVAALGWLLRRLRDQRGSFDLTYGTAATPPEASTSILPRRPCLVILQVFRL